jgi:hypothetical protein
LFVKGFEKNVFEDLKREGCFRNHLQKKAMVSFRKRPRGAGGVFSRKINFREIEKQCFDHQRDKMCLFLAA